MWPTGVRAGVASIPEFRGTLAGVKVLVVEDDVKLASFLCRALTEESFEVALARSGGEALAAVDAGAPDVVLLDWMIPAPDGLEVCRALRRHGHRLPILLLTARGELEDRVLGLDSGADDYLVKPFEIEELLARVRALVRRSELAETHVGPLSIDWRGRQVRVDGRAVDLTAREFDLLACFARHPDEVVSKRDLLQQVWRLAFDPGTNLVEVHVSRLRGKLGPAGALIETVRGGGYRLRLGRD
jgi:DNA-binding response OmpR family regulator